MIVVTGATGLLGGNLVRALLEEGYKATRTEDLHLTKEFELADFEHWK